MTIRLGLLCAVLLSISLAAGCSKNTSDGSDEKVTTLGTTEVTAELTEIPGPFPPNKLYDYAYVLKYKVLKTHRGKPMTETILVAQYNPLKPRSEAADAKAPGIGGTLKSFNAGDVHRLALVSPLDDNYMGPLINKYHAAPASQPSETQPAASSNSPVEAATPEIYWALWTNRVSP